MSCCPRFALSIASVNAYTDTLNHYPNNSGSPPTR